MEKTDRQADTSLMDVHLSLDVASATTGQSAGETSLMIFSQTDSIHEHDTQTKTDSQTAHCKSVTH